MSILARNGIWLSKQPSGAPWGTTPARTDGVLEAIANGRLTLASTGADVQLASTHSNVLIGAMGSSNVVTVALKGVSIAGDTFVSSNVYVGVPASNATAAEALALADGAGLVVAWSNDRSIRWRRLGDLSNAQAVGGASNGAFWEVRGGGLRLTAQVKAGVGGYSTGDVPPVSRLDREVGFGWRVNEFDELEMYKRVCNSNATEAAASYRAVVCFGGASGSNRGIVLPSSVDPWYGVPQASNSSGGTSGNMGGSSNGMGGSSGGMGGSSGGMGGSTGGTSSNTATTWSTASEVPSIFVSAADLSHKNTR
jgi:hypothetical protein